jgi:hypothetical protein
MGLILLVMMVYDADGDYGGWIWVWISFLQKERYRTALIQLASEYARFSIISHLLL